MHCDLYISSALHSWLWRSRILVLYSFLSFISVFNDECCAIRNPVNEVQLSQPCVSVTSPWQWRYSLWQRNGWIDYILSEHLSFSQSLQKQVSLRLLQHALWIIHRIFDIYRTTKWQEKSKTNWLADLISRTQPQCSNIQICVYKLIIYSPKNQKTNTTFFIEKIKSIKMFVLLCNIIFMTIKHCSPNSH